MCPLACRLLAGRARLAHSRILAMPSAIVTASGTVYLARGGRPEAVGILDQQLNLAGMVPADTTRLATPHAIAVQGDTVIYVADALGRRIRKFVKR